MAYVRQCIDAPSPDFIPPNLKPPILFFRELRVSIQPITDAGYRQLQSALPNTEIQADLPAASEQHQYPFWGGNLDL